MRRWLWLSSLLLCLLVALPALAHKASDSYLLLQPAEHGLVGRWDIALRDLNDALDLDTNADARLTWGELRAAQERIASYAQGSLHVHSGSEACRVALGELSVVRHSDGAYAVLDVKATCVQPVSALQLRYDLLFDLDAQHRGIVRTSDTDAPLVLTKTRREAALTAARPAGAALVRAIELGVQHILHGYDHLLFLLALLLASPVRREAGRWVAVPGFRRVLTDVTRIVTAFTLAHSITLALSALHWVTLPSRFVESAIALSVVLAAANNLVPVVRSERWLVAFALGLLHGFGFAAALADAGLSGSSLVRTLLGFNLGVELGQIAVVVLVLPLIYWLRASRSYQRIGLAFGSVAVLAVATIWFVERAFDLKILS